MAATIKVSKSRADLEDLLRPQTPGVHLNRFWSGTCYRGFKDIPYTNFWKRYTRPYTNFSYKVHQNLKSYTGISKIGTVPYTKIVKIDSVAYTNMWKVDKLPNGTSPYPKYMYCTPGPKQARYRLVGVSC